MRNSDISHSRFAALFWAGVICILGTPTRHRRIGNGIALVLAPIVIMIGDFVFYLTALWIAFVWAHPRDSSFARTVLGPEIESGVLSDEEVTAADGLRWVRIAPGQVTRRRPARC